MPQLRCYDPGEAGAGIHQWYADVPAATQAAIDAALENIIDEVDLEALPQFKALRGACKGLDEIIVDVRAGPKYRILCFRGPGRGDLTLLSGFEKSARGSVDYGPHCWSANKRKEGVTRDGRRAPRCRFP